MDLQLHRQHTHSTVEMLRKSAVSVGLQASRQRHAWVARSSAALSAARRGSASSVAAVGKLKTVDELGGPSLVTSLYWLFLKGYFKTTQQMQVSPTGASGLGSAGPP